LHYALGAKHVKVMQFFVWTILPVGALIMLMMLSNQGLLMSVASRILGSPIKTPWFSVSMALVMVAICLCATILTRSNMGRCEARLSENELHAAASRDALLRDVFSAGRNFYICLLGLTLWTVSWRLKALHDREQLKVPPTRRHHRPRTMYLLLGIFVLVMADLPLCRLNYCFTIMQFVTPKKEELVQAVGECRFQYKGKADAKCQTYCEQVYKVAEDRLWAVEWARKYHVVGRLAAQIFDKFRGVQQEKARIDSLFEQKTCFDVLKSVDKSNTLVNWMCVAACVLALYGGLHFLTLAFHAEEREHKD